MARVLIFTTGLLTEAAAIICRTSEPETSTILTIVGVTATCASVLLGQPMRLLCDHFVGADLPEGPA